MKRITGVHFIKPLIHPPIYKDESPLGYLVRVAELNRYSSFRWLNQGTKVLNVGSSRDLYSNLASAEWTKCDLDNVLVKDVFTAEKRHLIVKKLRFCPLCIRQYGYYKMHWQYRAAIACVEHEIWLHDACHYCGKDVAQRNTRIRLCDCGFDITDVDVERVSDEVLLMQLFLEGATEPKDTNLPLLKARHDLTKNERVNILHFFAKWLPNSVFFKKERAILLREMSTAQDVMMDVAEALFTGHAGYHNFLKRLHALGNSPSGVDLFTKFYRDFYSNFTKSCFQGYKKYLEQYLNKYWEKPLTKRNLHFDKQTLESHPWISFQTACREYDLHKSELNSALLKRIVRSKVSEIENRTFTLIFKPDLEARLYRIKDLICAKESASILGVTKLQFSKLQESGCFDVMIKPDTYGNSIWQFSRDEILHYKNTLLQDLAEVTVEYWTFPELLKFFGGQIDNSLITILKAIEEKKLKVFTKLKGASGLSSMVFDKNDFMEWYECYKAEDELLSIPTTAKLLGLQQQFTYQLVDMGLIETQSKNSTSLRWVSKKQIDDFRERYVLLSKLAKQAQLNSRALMNHLAGRDIYPVDEQWETPLRQKVYERQNLTNVQLIADYLPFISP